MAKRKSVTLYTPDGRSYTTSDPVEITRLKAHGYTDKNPNAKQQSAKPQSTSTPSGS